MQATNRVNERIESFIMSKFPQARKRRIGQSDNLLESGIVDSLGVLDLVTFLQQEFAIEISDDELTPENFQSMENISTFVHSKMS